MDLRTRRLVSYDIPLTLEGDQFLLVSLVLPMDLTWPEAERLVGVIRTLPMGARETVQ